MRSYKHPAMKQLKDQQVRFAPVERRLDQLNRAERLLTEIEPARKYPYQYVCFRITDFRSESYPQLLVDGADLEHDLTLFIQDLAATVPAVPADQMPEPVLTLDEVSRNLKVSTKTISRWRDRGLLSRRVICGGRRKVAIRQSLLQRFLEKNQDHVDKSARFTQLTEQEKGEIVRRARRMASHAPDRFTDICRRIAKRLGRSPETVRYTIKNFDQKHPQQAIFPQVGSPLDDQAKQAIYGSYRRGMAINALAERFDRTRTSVYRIINEVRAKRLLEGKFDCIPHASFDDANQADDILAPMPDHDAYEASRIKARLRLPRVCRRS